MLTAILMTAVAIGPHSGTHYHDVVAQQDGSGQYIIRTAQMPDFSGGSVTVEQRLRVLPGGEYEVDSDQQSAATKVYHQALCLQEGMIPKPGRSVLSGDAAVGAWLCMSDDSDVGEAESLSDLTGPTEEIGSRSTDYAIAVAPSGAAQVNQNFFARGSIRVQSSVAGQISYHIEVDGGRCIIRDIQFYSKPFTHTVNGGVSCIAYRQGFLSTEAAGCVPKACSRNAGTYSIR